MFDERRGRRDTDSRSFLMAGSHRDATPVFVIQWHGMAASTSWDVDVPGTNSCGLNATENMQGRLLNGVPAQNVCSVQASTVSQKFIHIEQDRTSATRRIGPRQS